MGDDGSSSSSSSSSNRSLLENLRHEWALLWHSISGDEIEFQNVQQLGQDFFEKLDFEQLRKIGKKLSNERKIVHQQLEHMQKELEILNAKAEGLKLVGGEAGETEKRIDQLHDQGVLLTDQLQVIDQKLKLIRERELQILEELE